MRSVLFFLLSVVATLAAARENPFNIPGSGYEFTAGESTTLSWDPTTEGTVSLKLQWGDDFTSSTGSTIVSGISNSGSYTWDVPTDITDRSDYSVEIVSDSDPEGANYLPRFSIEGAQATATTTTSTSTQTTDTETSTTETSTTETETSTTETPTTLATTTTSTTTTSTEETPTPTSTTSSTTTPANSSSTEASSTTSASETPTETPSSVPNVNDGDNAGMANRVSGAMLALALGVVAVI
ncbi:Ser-Thr-rich glycosyl-phosphatidyl-inositol-anchored membrane family-domain-containing protein [Aspergillus cavernicola]|uniref:Ser-Thr-rich glycosyl-phosphatidyl-inositol-anchored membrane family-domain-containing protein n=1 Tax=Aspergillus cavernicola TaxID=176166 RepID=A0ABR4I9V9_9EURO